MRPICWTREAVVCCMQPSLCATLVMPSSPVERGCGYLLFQETLEDCGLRASNISSCLSGIATRTETEGGEDESFTKERTKDPGDQFRETHEKPWTMSCRLGSERTRRIKQSTFTDHVVRHINGGGGWGGGRVIIPIPREATSVATMMGLLPVLNSFRTQSRSFCCLSPWMAGES